MIGILDSGSGGLTVMKAIREQLPSSDVVYFGDIKNAPYGSKSPRELSQLTAEAILLLKERKADRIVSACNSVSASLAVSLLDVFAITPNQLVEMVGPTVGYFRNVEKRIALCATPATVAAGMYENGFHMIGIEPRSIAIPDLAAAIEFGASSGDIKSIIENALVPFRGQFDVLILACTHYPLVQHIFAEVLGPDIMLFDPAEAVATRAKQLFWPQEVAFGTTHFIISQESEQFREYVRKLFPTLTYTIEVVP